MGRTPDGTRIAASYLERGLGLVGAFNHTMNLHWFADGRSAAIELLVGWERLDRMKRARAAKESP